MFLQACVKNSVRGGVSQHALRQTPPPSGCWDTHTHWADTSPPTECILVISIVELSQFQTKAIRLSKNRFNFREHAKVTSTSDYFL